MSQSTLTDPSMASSSPLSSHGSALYSLSPPRSTACEPSARAGESAVTNWERLVRKAVAQPVRDMCFARVNAEHRVEQAKQAILIYLVAVLVSMVSAWFREASALDVGLRTAVCVANVLFFVKLALYADETFLTRLDGWLLAYAAANLPGVAFISHASTWGMAAFVDMALLQGELPAAYSMALVGLGAIAIGSTGLPAVRHVLHAVPSVQYASADGPWPQPWPSLYALSLYAPTALFIAKAAHARLVAARAVFDTMYDRVMEQPAVRNAVHPVRVASGLLSAAQRAYYARTALSGAWRHGAHTVDVLALVDELCHAWLVAPRMTARAAALEWAAHGAEPAPDGQEAQAGAARTAAAPPLEPLPSAAGARAEASARPAEAVGAERRDLDDAPLGPGGVRVSILPELQLPQAVCLTDPLPSRHPRAASASAAPGGELSSSWPRVHLSPPTPRRSSSTSSAGSGRAGAVLPAPIPSRWGGSHADALAVSPAHVRGSRTFEFVMSQSATGNTPIDRVWAGRLQRLSSAAASPHARPADPPRASSVEAAELALPAPARAPARADAAPTRRRERGGAAARSAWACPPLVRVEELKWMPEEEYILSGYRENFSARQNGASLFALHNQTVAVWTHLLPAVLLPAAYAAVHARHLADAPAELRFASAFAAALQTSQLLASALAHTFYNESMRHYRLWWKLDFTFICVGMYAYCLRFGYAALMCTTAERRAMFWMLAAGACCVSVTVTLSAAKEAHRVLGMVFVFSVCNVLPQASLMYALGGVGEHGPVLGSVLGSYLSFGTALVFYVTKWPERLAPGRFDVWGHSHQLWHVGIAGAHLWDALYMPVVLGALVRAGVDCSKLQ